MDFRPSKSAKIMKLKFRALKCVKIALFGPLKSHIFVNFRTSKSAKTHEKSKFRAPKCIQMADFVLLEPSKLISHKI